MELSKARARDRGVAVGTVLLTEVRAALAAGVPPGPAFVAAVEVASENAESDGIGGAPDVGDGVRGARGAAAAPRVGGAGAAAAAGVAAAAVRIRRDRRRVDGPPQLTGVARSVRLGTPLAEVAQTAATGDAAADLLVQALGVVDRVGAGAVAAVDQVLTAVRDEADLARLLRVRTTQARGTAAVLTLIPVAVWFLLVALDRSALGFYRTTGGIATGALAVLLAASGQWWSRRLVRRAAGAAAALDPLAPPVAPWRPLRGAVLALPALLLLGGAVGPGAGVLTAVLAGGLGSRPARTRGAQAPHPGGSVEGGAAETVELVAIALQAGMPPGEAVAVVAPLAPSRARGPLLAASRRLRAGWPADSAFAATGLALLGTALAACERWGAPAGDVLQRVAGDLRADRRAAAEEAAERTQLALVFPTTLLTLPAFVLGVVPPLLWTALGR